MHNKNDSLFKSQQITYNKTINVLCTKKLFEIYTGDKIKISLIIKIVEIIILILIFYQIYENYINVYNRINSYNQKFLKQSFAPMKIAHNNSINFVNTCESPDLIHFQHSIDFNLTNPKISVVIPLYNCQKFILRAIKSIQLQNVSNFEIVLIDDCSKDNTYKIVNNIQKEDNRIRILKNRINKGILYTRSIGVLLSKGKYLFNLDNDDLFMNNDIFYTITQINEEGNFDIVEFKAISNKNINRNILNSRLRDAKFTHPEQFILFQPELGLYPIPIGNKPGSYGLRDIFLWGKCIKTEIYQKALNKLGPPRYSRLMIRYEDIVTNYMIFNTAKSFIYVKKYGLYHIVRSGSGVDIGWNKIPRLINILYLIDIVIDFSLNRKDNKKLAAYLIIYFLHLSKVKKTLIRSRYRMNLFISCLRRAFNSPYISVNDKSIIRNLLKRHQYIHFNEF